MPERMLRLCLLRLLLASGLLLPWQLAGSVPGPPHSGLGVDWQKALQNLQLDFSYRPPPLWGCQAPALAHGEFHVVVATVSPEPAQLLPWVWHLGLTGAHIYIYHRLELSDPRFAAANATLASMQLPCGMRPLLTQVGRWRWRRWHAMRLQATCVVGCSEP
jgi:hypothetical protein